MKLISSSYEQRNHKLKLLLSECILILYDWILDRCLFGAFYGRILPPGRWHGRMASSRAQRKRLGVVQVGGRADVA